MQYELRIALVVTFLLLFAPAGRSAAEPPNVLIILADDLGYSDLGCYGGEIETPNLDRLAAGGLRFTQFYNTARCWPTRAALLTGYYAQQVRRDKVPGISSGGRGRRPPWARLLPDMLRPLGFRSYHSGKWHIDGMPLATGFDRSYYVQDQGRFFSPRVHYRDDQKLPPVEPDTGYYATTAIADHAIECLRNHVAEHADRPFFHYLAFTCPHFPLHALPHDIARYRDRYRQGWEQIRAERWQRIRRQSSGQNAPTPNPSPESRSRLPGGTSGTTADPRSEGERTAETERVVGGSARQAGPTSGGGGGGLEEMGLVEGRLSPVERDVGPPYHFPEALKTLGPGEVNRPLPWNELTDAQRTFQATKMAIHAAMIDRMDREIGRVLEQLRVMNALDNTLIFFLSDNGASAEIMVRDDGHDSSADAGSAATYLCLGPGWSTASNTPFRRHKTWVHEGGIATPLVVHWPAGIEAQGELRHNPGHVIDLVPTILEAVGGARFEMWDGRPVPPAPGKSLVPAFAQNGTVLRHYLWWCHEGNRALRVGDWKLVAAGENGPWELYDLESDRTETKNLAEQHPDKLRELEEAWTQRWNEFQTLARQDKK